ncbi:MAG: heme biosynthesis protein HemY [Hyphomicrobiales bacterium]
MLRVVVVFLSIVLLTLVMVWFADRPGELSVSWLGYEIRTSFMLALGAVILLVAALMFVLSLVRGLLGMPGMISDFFRTRRQMRGLEALTRGVVAAGAGDAVAAARYSTQANRILTNEPLAQLLKAQAAQLSGDRATVHRVFDAMLQDTETEALGLRGLFVQARQEGDLEQARAYAERAFAISPRLAWAARAVLAVQSSEGNWTAVEQTLEQCRKNKLIEAAEAARKKAVVLTARAADLEDRTPDRALELAQQAHKAAPDLVPAAVTAGRLLAATGQTRKAGRVLEKTWRLAPHPEIAQVYAHARPGSAPRDRLKRLAALVRRAPGGVEGPIAVARAAVEAANWAEAREALKPLVEDRPSSRVCSLMAEIEDGEFADEGRAREWLGRAVHAPRDPIWTADGFTSETWRAYSPETGELDAFVWKVPVEGLTYHDAPAEPVPAERIAPAVAEEEPAPEPEPAPEDAGEPEAETADHEVIEAVPEAAEVIEEQPPAEAEEDAEPPPPEAAGDDGAEPKPKPKERRRKAADADGEKPTIFVPPHAPDDPGPEPREDSDRPTDMFQAQLER